MSLEQDLQNALVEAGEKLKKDLWSPTDVMVLAQRAKELADLERKAKMASDPNKKAQYKLAATLVMDHVQLLALTRMSIAEKQIEQAIGKAFISGLSSTLSTLIPNVR